jgi:alpha-beta hydrolase superfamily lysophospholipase
VAEAMDETTFTYQSADGLDIAVRRWSATGPTGGGPTGSVQIAHGMGEHSARYARLAGALTAHGWVVYADDHRGHGRTAVGLDGAGPAEALGDFGPDGWNGLVDDLALLGQRITAEVPDRPHILLGHSMGSFAAQQLVLDHSQTIDGLILSGTTAVDLAATTMDPKAETDLTALNAAFEPARTPFDWLSRDDAEVDAYLADAWCGFGIDRAATAGLVAAAPRLADADALAGIRPDLPLYVVAGSEDPLNLGLALLDLLVQRYRDAGLTDITTAYYPDARHEVFNETNRDEITADLLGWMARFGPA